MKITAAVVIFMVIRRRRPLPIQRSSELWLCNPALGLAALSPPAAPVLSSLKEPYGGAHNWPLFKRGSQFWAQLRAPRPRLLLPGVAGIIPGAAAEPAA